MTVMMGLKTRLQLAKLQLVVDTRARQGDFTDIVVAALRGGVDVVQVRDRHATTEQLAQAYEVARDAASQVNALAAINRDLRAATRVGADLLHLGAADGPLQTARGVLHEYGLLGRSVHHREDFRHINADYLFVGPVYSDAPGTPGLDIVREAAKRLHVNDLTAVPWFAIGGINAQNLAPVLEAGALRIAVSDAITEASDPQAAAAELKQLVQAAWDARPEMERFTISALGGGAPHVKLLGSPE